MASVPAMGHDGTTAEPGDPHRAARRRIVRLQRWVLNPPTLLATWWGLVPGHAVLETVGRTSGSPRRVVVGVDRRDDIVWIVAEHGLAAGYVRNLLANPVVRLRMGRRWWVGTSRVRPDDDAVERLRSFGRPTHEAAVRRFGTDLLSVEVTLDAAPGGRPTTG